MFSDCPLQPSNISINQKSPDKWFDFERNELSRGQFVKFYYAFLYQVEGIEISYRTFPQLILISKNRMNDFYGSK